MTVEQRPEPQPAAIATKSTSPTVSHSDDNKFTNAEGTDTHTEGTETTEGAEGITSTETENSTERDIPAVSNNNPHSLGASLINSVPQLAKKPKHRESTEEDDKFEPVTKVTTASFWSSSPEDKNLIFTENTARHEDYEYVYDPESLKTNLESLRNAREPNYKRQILKTADACIFPMTRAQTRLWELKNLPRKDIIAKQSHLLKKPIYSLKTYPFVRQNIVMHRQALRPLLCNCISKLKRYEYLRKLRLKKALCGVESQWQANCAKMDAMSHELRKEEIHRKEQAELELKERERQEKELQERKARLSGSSRRRNRADFVDDAEIENVLLQIDPVYKHLQCAAEIPSIIIDPLERNALKFKDVNNLVTDKDGWARRIIEDGAESFTQQEHDLFVEGYLSYPKKFLKISNHMGGLRTPEECVQHYYRTKSSAAYKKLLNDKNKKRQKSSTSKRNKKREKAYDTDNEPSMTLSEHVEPDGIHKESSNELLVEDREDKSIRHMEQVEIKLLQSRSKNVDGGAGVPGDARIKQSVIPKDAQAVTKKEDDTIRMLEAPNDGAARENNSITGLPSTGAIIETTGYKSAVCTSSPENTRSSVVKAFTSSADHGDAFTDNYESSNDEGQQKKRQKHSGEHKSSYWSVKEATFFPELLKQYGSQWSLISDKLGTKSTTMVRNYYQRNAAQFGWKPLVEEADFKRNATSSGSVQQSQILLQSEQTPLPMSNGVPSQLWPALGFFINGSNNKSSGANEESTVSADNDKHQTSLPPQAPETSTQSFSPNYNKEPLFAELSAPGNGLPAPRLPSIQLPASSEIKKEKPLHSGSHLKDILNEDHQNDKAGPASTWHHAVVNGHTSPATVEQTQQASTVRPRISNLVIQELQNSGSIPSSSRRSSSLSLLLNPESDAAASHKPLIPAAIQKKPEAVAAQSHPSATQQQQHDISGSPTSSSKINFAMDPLGALAAVASESLMETDKRS